MAAAAIVPIAPSAPRSGCRLSGLSVTEFQSNENRTIRLEPRNEVTIVLSLRHRAELESTWSHQIIRGSLKAGQVFVVPPRTHTEWRWQSPHHLLYIGIAEHALRISNSEAGTSSEAPVLVQPSRFHNDSVLTHLCQSLLRESVSNEVGSELSAEALAHLIRVHVARTYTSREQKQAPGGLPPHRLKAALAYIDANLKEAIRLCDLAKVAGLSAQHFCRMFKVSVGMTPHRYITEQRVERAKDMLRDGRMSLVDVALETGFPSQSHFGCTFRKVTGVTPGRFRALS
jgi:AraC family transcriptional regulator